VGVRVSRMADKSSLRGAVSISGTRLDWLRFELSSAVLLSAAIFALVGLLDGMARSAEVPLLVAAMGLFELSGTELDILGRGIQAARIVLMATVTVWLYLAAGHLLRTWEFAFVHASRMLGGNRLRLIAIFILLTVTLMGLDGFVQPATTRLARALSNPLSWTLEDALIRYLIDFPFSMLWTVVWAVAVGLVLDALEAPASSDDGDRSAIEDARTAS
jgi:hypothetical protein